MGGKAKRPVAKAGVAVESAGHKPVAPPPVQVPTTQDKVVAADDSMTSHAFNDTIVEKPVDAGVALGPPPSQAPSQAPAPASAPASAPTATPKRISRFKARRQGL